MTVYFPMVNFGNTVYLKYTDLFAAAVVASEILLLNLGNLLKLSSCNNIFSGIVQISEPVSIKAI